MINARELTKRAEKAILANSPAIMTAVGVAGTVTTAFLTARATLRAVKKIEAEQFADRGVAWRVLDRKEKIKLVWTEYIPPVASLIVTASAIVAANRIGSRRTAAVASAMLGAQRTLEEYKDIVVEKFGESKAQDIQDAAAQKNVQNDPPANNTVIITSQGKHLCKLVLTGQYFESSMNALRKAENDFDWMLRHTGYSSLGDLQQYLEIDTTSLSETLGWQAGSAVDFNITTAIVERDGTEVPCFVINLGRDPIYDYYKGHR